MANPLQIDPATLTVGELYAIWELTDLEIPEILAAFTNGVGATHPGFVLALILIEMKRQNLDVTLADAGSVVYRSLIEESSDDG